MEISKIIQTIKDISFRYGLEIIYLEHTESTLIYRFGFSSDIFIQIYTNVKKDKINMALIVANRRIYGIDKEGGFYHEHPFENPLLHVKSEQIEIEDFVIKSLEYIKKLKLI